MDNNYNYSLADLMSVIGNNGNYNGGSSLWLIIFFVIIFGGGGYGWNNRGGYGYGAGGELSGYASAASQQDILFSSKFQNLDSKMDKIGYGICDSTYALSQQINGAQSTIGGAIVNEGRAIQTQLANATLDNQRNVDSVRYDMANFAASINSNIDNKFAAIEKSQLEQRLASQAQQISQLQMQASLCGIPRISTYAWGTYPYTAPPVPSCGCNCGNI